MKEELYKNAAEYGALHNEDCCVNSDGGCDVGTSTLGCCENMEMVKGIIDDTRTRLTEYFSHDISFKNEEQRFAAVKMYLSV